MVGEACKEFFLVEAVQLCVAGVHDDLLAFVGPGVVRELKDSVDTASIQFVWNRTYRVAFIGSVTGFTALRK